MPESTVAQHLVDYEPVLGLGGGPGPSPRRSGAVVR